MTVAFMAQTGAFRGEKVSNVNIHARMSGVAQNCHRKLLLISIQWTLNHFLEWLL